MEIILSKLIPLFVYPLGLILIILLITLVWLIRQRQKGGAILVAMAVILILVTGNSSVASWLYGNLESQYSPTKVEDTPDADVIVVLGAGLGLPFPPRIYADLHGSADRLLHASRLYRAGKAPHVIVSGGNLFTQEGFEGESFYAAQLLMEWGVPENAIVIEAESKNTLQNAEFTQTILAERKWEEVLLVTSAAHMPRAVEAFDRVGVAVHPIPVDFIDVEEYQPELLNWIPQVDALGTTTLALKEYLGRLWYRVRGWLV